MKFKLLALVGVLSSLALTGCIKDESQSAPFRVYDGSTGQTLPLPPPPDPVSFPYDPGVTYDAPSGSIEQNSAGQSAYSNPREGAPSGELDADGFPVGS